MLTTEINFLNPRSESSSFQRHNGKWRVQMKSGMRRINRPGDSRILEFIRQHELHIGLLHLSNLDIYESLGKVTPCLTSIPASLMAGQGTHQQSYSIG